MVHWLSLHLAGLSHVGLLAWGMLRRLRVWRSLRPLRCRLSSWGCAGWGSSEVLHVVVLLDFARALEVVDARGNNMLTFGRAG